MTCPRSKSWWMPSALFIKVILSSLLCPHPNRVSLAHSCMLLVMDWRAWKAAIHGAAEGWARLSDFTFTFHFHALEKEMATHSSVLAWRIPGTGEPHGLPSMRSHRVGHDWSDLAAAAGYMMEKAMDPTPVLLPGKSHGWRSLVGCSPWGRKESDTTEWLHFHLLEKEMATHSSILAWRIPGMEEPGGLPSMGSHRVRHEWSDWAAAATAAGYMILFLLL